MYIYSLNFDFFFFQMDCSGSIEAPLLISAPLQKKRAIRAIMVAAAAAARCSVPLSGGREPWERKRSKRQR